MFYHLLYPLKNHISFFNIFRYITTRSGGAFLTALTLTLIFTPYFIKRRPISERISDRVPKNHEKKSGTPTSGGVVFIVTAIISTLLWAKLTVAFVYLAIFVTLYMAFMGLYDDIVKLHGREKEGLSIKSKLVFQFILSVIVVISLYRLYPQNIVTKTQFLSFKNINIDFGIFYILFVMFVFVGTTNSVNLTDGLDGLAASTYIPVIGVFILLAYFEGHKVLAGYLHLLKINEIGELAIFGSAIAGGVLGFLWYNAYPAEIFMGDTGSQGLGGALAIMSILTKQELLLPVAGFVFLWETMSVIIQIYVYRKSGGKRRFFKKAPIHHHFELLGWKEPKIVARMWIISLLSSILALTLIKIR